MSDSPVSEDPSAGPRTSCGPGRRVALIVAGLIALIAWSTDQLTKRIVETSMELGDELEVLPSVLYWRYHLNPGAAFSIGTDYTWVFTLVMAAVLIFVIWSSRRLGGSWLWIVALGGLAGGVAGNLTDRLFRAPSYVDGGFESFGQGHVVDFIAVPGFAIFNVADSFIVCCIIGVCALMLFGVEVDGTRQGKQDSSPSASEGEADAASEGEEPNR